MFINWIINTYIYNLGNKTYLLNQNGYKVYLKNDKLTFMQRHWVPLKLFMIVLVYEIFFLTVLDKML